MIGFIRKNGYSRMELDGENGDWTKMRFRRHGQAHFREGHQQKMANQWMGEEDDSEPMPFLGLEEFKK